MRQQLSVVTAPVTQLWVQQLYPAGYGTCMKNCTTGGDTVALLSDMHFTHRGGEVCCSGQLKQGSYCQYLPCLSIENIILRFGWKRTAH